MPTKFDNIDIAKVRQFMYKKHIVRNIALDAHYTKAAHDFEQICTLIIAKYNPACIWQWGSLLDRRRFSEISDIDIALEGLRSVEEYSAILSDIIAITDFPVDLVEMERIGVENAAFIRKYGRLIYERPKSGK